MSAGPHVGRQGGDRIDRRPGTARRVLGLAVGLVASAALVLGAVHGVRSTAADADDSALASARVDVAYYACLAAQVHSLVRPGEVVAVSTADPGTWATLSKAVAPWAVITASPGQAVAVLSLQPRHGGGACLGQVVVARARDGLVRRGTGASLPGDEPPPPTPL